MDGGKCLGNPGWGRFAGHGGCRSFGMTDKRTAAQSGQGNAQKDPGDWVTGDEPMTGAQRSYLKTLSDGFRP